MDDFLKNGRREFISVAHFLEIGRREYISVAQFLEIGRREYISVAQFSKIKPSFSQIKFNSLSFKKEFI